MVAGVSDEQRQKQTSADRVLGEVLRPSSMSNERTQVVFMIIYCRVV